MMAGAPVPSLPRDREVVVYDSDPNELASSEVAAELIRQGYRAAALKGGIVDWLAANLPTETKEAPQASPARTRGVERLARRFPFHHDRSPATRSQLALATMRGDARRSSALGARGRLGARRSASSRTPTPARCSRTRRPAAIPKCSSGSGRCTRPAAGCWSNRRSPIFPPICAGCSNRARSPSSSSACCTAQLGVTSAAEIGAAVREQKLRGLPGFDATVEAAIDAALPALRSRVPRIPLGRAVAIAEPILEPLRACPASPGRCRSARCAAARTWSATSRSSPPTDRPDAALEAVLEPARSSTHVLHRSERRLYLLIDRVQIGVRLPEPPNAGADLLFLTGSLAHFEGAAGARGGEGPDADARPASTRATASLIPAATEDEIYAALGLPFIPPEIRNGDDEIALREPRRAAGAGLARGHPRRSAHALAVERRPRLDRSDGQRRAARSATSTSRSPITRRTRRRRATCTVDGVKKQADEIAAAARAVTRTSRSCTAAKWTSCRTAGSISPTGSSSSSTSCSRRCTSAPGTAPDQLLQPLRRRR